MIETGKHVKIILRNGAMAEGIVEEWYANEVKLKSLDGESFLIITHPAEDIMLIKVFLKEPEEKQEELQEEQIELEQKFDATHEATDPHDIDGVKSLAQLRIELIKQDRKIIAEKLKNHIPSTGPGKVQYGYPGLGKKPRTK